MSKRKTNKQIDGPVNKAAVEPRPLGTGTRAETKAPVDLRGDFQTDAAGNTVRVDEPKAVHFELDTPVIPSQPFDASPDPVAVPGEPTPPTRRDADHMTDYHVERYEWLQAKGRELVEAYAHFHDNRAYMQAAFAKFQEAIA